jgi:hypothetical protein
MTECAISFQALRISGIKPIRAARRRNVADAIQRSRLAYIRARSQDHLTCTAVAPFQPHLALRWEEQTMCDYSLMALPNRLAVCGEELVVHRFELGSVGLAAPADVYRRKKQNEVPASGFFAKLRRALFPPVMECCSAVCIPPGARLLVRDIPESLQVELELDSPVQEVVFTQLSTVGYRDAIRFENGLEVLLQRLVEGQRVRVLALSGQEEPADEFAPSVLSGF